MIFSLDDMVRRRGTEIAETDYGQPEKVLIRCVGPAAFFPVDGHERARRWLRGLIRTRNVGTRCEQTSSE